MSLKRLAINTAVVLGILTLLLLLYEFREAVVVFVFSLGIAAAARPFVISLTNRKVPTGLAIVLVYATFSLFIIGIFWAAGGVLLSDFQHLSDNLATTYDQTWTSWHKGSNFQQMIVQQLPAPADLYKGFTPERASATLNSLLGFTMSSVTLIGEAFTVLVLSIYWSIDRVHFERLWLSLLPAKSRAQSREVWRAIERDFGEYVRSQVLQSIFAGLLLGAGLWVMGVDYPVLLAVFAALIWLIPWLGGVLVVLPIALTGFSQSMVLGIGATVYAIAILFLLDFLIEPKFVRRRQFSSLLSILLIIALVGPFGLLGFIVAPPLAAAIELVFRYNLQARQVSATVQDAERVTELHARLLQVREAVSHAAEPLEPQALNLLERLEDLVNRAEEALEEEKPGPVAKQAGMRLP